MPALGKMVFKGKSGKAYRFKIYPLGTKFRKVSGVFVIGNQAHAPKGAHRLVPLFVGHTEDFSQPFALHRKAKQCSEQGANCICLQSDALEESRMAKEQDLVAGLLPVCNE